MLKHILIKQFVNGLNHEVSRERVILKAPKTLTEAEQFARFSESAVQITRNHCTSTSTPSTVSSVGFRGRGSSSGPRGFATCGREQSVTRDNKFCGRGRGRSSGRETFSMGSRSSSSNPKFGQSKQKSQQQSPRAIVFQLSKVWSLRALLPQSLKQWLRSRSWERWELEGAPTPEPSLLEL